MDCGAEWVVGCGFGHCQNGSRCQGQNPVHLKGFDGHFQVFAHHDSGLKNVFCSEALSCGL